MQFPWFNLKGMH